MADIVENAVRSRMMAGIGQRDTRPELLVRHGLHRLGFRYRIADKSLPGRPDIVLPRHRAVIFVHGCFWHRHRDCRYATTPSTRPDFWAAKFARNVERDAEVVGALRTLGWRVATIWECETRRDAAGAVATLGAWLRSPSTAMEYPTVQGC